MQLRCVAIDDEPPALALLREYVSRIPSIQMVQTFDDAITASEYLRTAQIDLLFLDINMPHITGLDLARSLQSPPMIIFTTAYKKFAFEGFELDAIDYLLKPVSFDRFAKSINKAIEYFQHKKKPVDQESQSLFVYSEYKMVRISLSEIEYIESLEDYIRIHLQNSAPVLTLMPLKKVLEKLPEERFKRIHRSYIVATDKVTSVKNRKLMLKSNVELPVSDTYASFLKEWIR